MCAHRTMTRSITEDGETEAGAGRIALALGGGGARAAYQVGFLRYLAREHADLKIPILTGVSAGAINSTFLANRVGPVLGSVDDLAKLWSELHTEDVFDVSSVSLGGIVARWGARLIGGGSQMLNVTRGLVDTDPLRQLLHEKLGADEYGRLTGIAENLAHHDLEAAALTTTNYGTGQSITWVQGKGRRWRRRHRLSAHDELNVEHVMASAALPIFFPAAKIGTDWHGDGGIRLTAPLSQRG